jgi:hypothetical protein
VGVSRSAWGGAGGGGNRGLLVSIATTATLRVLQGWTACRNEVVRRICRSGIPACQRWKVLAECATCSRSCETRWCGWVQSHHKGTFVLPCFTAGLAPHAAVMKGMLVWLGPDSHHTVLYNMPLLLCRSAGAGRRAGGTSLGAQHAAGAECACAHHQV